MLSQGMLPHVVHGRYPTESRTATNLPSPNQWEQAERRQRELQSELDLIERKLSRKASDIRAKSTSTSSASASATFAGSHPLFGGSYSERAVTAPVVGSTFRFHSVDGRSTANSDFAWPQNEMDKIRLKNTQYGLCTRVCDVPGGNLNIRAGAGRKPRAYIDYMNHS